MGLDVDNWKTQIRKGYLEVCVLLLVRQLKSVYGFDLVMRLGELKLEVKEGTLYPMLSRMTADGLLAANWDTENLKGHPRKFYSLTTRGKGALDSMVAEFSEMVEIFHKLNLKAQKLSRVEKVEAI